MEATKRSASRDGKCGLEFSRFSESRQDVVTTCGVGQFVQKQSRVVGYGSLVARFSQSLSFRGAGMLPLWFFCCAVFYFLFGSSYGFGSFNVYGLSYTFS